MRFLKLFDIILFIITQHQMKGERYLGRYYEKRSFENPAVPWDFVLEVRERVGYVVHHVGSERELPPKIEAGIRDQISVALGNFNSRHKNHKALPCTVEIYQDASRV